MGDKKCVKWLRQIQADSHALFIKLHSFKWNIEGMNFMAVQNMTEELHDYMERVFNDSAEHIIQLDEKPLLTLTDLDKNRKIQDDPIQEGTYRYVAEKTIADLTLLKKDFEALEKVSKERENIFDFAHNNIGFIQKEIAAIECL